MAKKPTITTLTSGFNSTTTLNNNFTALRNAFDNTLSLDGSTPNAMNADLDMNSNDILNVGEIDVQGLTIDGVAVYPGNTQLATTYATQSYTGNGSTTVYSMGFNPGVKANVNVYIDGVHQNQDAFTISGTSLTFTAAPPLNSAIEIKVPVNVTSLTNTDSSVIVYNQGGAGAVTTNVKAKLQEFVSVKDFGAVGDGVTDDTAAIQAALDYAQSAQKAIFIPGGEYVFSQIVWPRGVRIIGEGTMGTLQTNDKYSQTILIQKDGVEKSGIILRDESLQAADLQMSDLILLGPVTQTSGSWHGIEFVNESGQDVAVQGQVIFERLFIRRWKGSGIKTSATKAVFAMHVEDVQSRNNGRYGFEVSYHPDSLALRNILTEKNRLAGVYLGAFPANFHSSIDGWYFEGGFPDQGFGTHPSFSVVSPYALEMDGCSTDPSNTIVRVSNVTVKADQTTSTTVDAAILQNIDAALHPMNIQWDNIVVETQGITSGNGDMLYDNRNSIRVGSEISSGHYFQDGTYWGVDYSGRRIFATSDADALRIERTGSNGAAITIVDDGTSVGTIGPTGGNSFVVANAVSDSGVQFGSDRIIPTRTDGTVLTETVDLGQNNAAYRIVFAREVRLAGGTIDIVSGTGSPEGVYTADVGSLYLREDGGAGSTLYIKETGTGNTGWAAK